MSCYFFCFDKRYFNIIGVIKVVLEEPYEFAKKQETTKNVNTQEFISENVSSIYNKANAVKNNFEIGKLFKSIKQFIASIKKIVLKIKLFVYNN